MLYARNYADVARLFELCNMNHIRTYEDADNGNNYHLWNPGHTRGQAILIEEFAKGYVHIYHEEDDEAAIIQIVKELTKGEDGAAALFCYDGRHELEFFWFVEDLMNESYRNSQLNEICGEWVEKYNQAREEAINNSIEFMDI